MNGPTKTVSKTLSKTGLIGILAALLMMSTPAFAKDHLHNTEPEQENYRIDVEGAHAFIQFKVSHLGFSWIYGRFNSFDGSFVVNNEDFAKSSVTLSIETASLDTNHAERDKHIRDKDFLNVSKYPQAGFVSTSIIPGEDDKATLIGDLTLHGVTKEIAIEISKIGEGTDPWGGFRMGFEGTTQINPRDFDVGPIWLGPITFDLVLEGIRQ